MAEPPKKGPWGGKRHPPWTPEEARIAGKKGGRAAQDKWRKALKVTDINQRDETNALRVLRKQMESPDERIAQAAALRILEWRKGRPAQAQAEQKDVRIIYESRALPPDSSTISD